MSRPQLSAVAETENALARAVVLFRVGGVMEIAMVFVFDATHDHHATRAGMYVAAAVVLESALLGGACLRRRQIRSAWAAADLAFTVLAQFLNAWAQIASHGTFSFMYPYVTIVSVDMGIGLRRWPSAGAATVALGVGNFTASVLISHHAADSALLFASLTVLPNALVAWSVSHHIRNTARQLEESRAETANLARQKERSWHARALHDHVLQTLEGIIRHDVIPHGTLRRQIQADTAWLRALVEGVAIGQGTDLLWRLRELVERHAAGGLRVEFNGAQLQRAAEARAGLQPELVDAVAGAVGEALTNTAKHAGVDHAVLHAALTDRTLTVSVLDDGAGFDPATTVHGLGLDQSITARIHEAGGQVRIDSSPGQGTYVEITVPATTTRAKR